MSRIRSNLELVNAASSLKLPADPRPHMCDIAAIAENCVRHHETLALSTWLSSLRKIREALETMEDIYDKAEERVS